MVDVDDLVMGNGNKLRRVDAVMTRHLQSAWDKSFSQACDPHVLIEKEERIFELVSSCDPTPQRRYLSWLSRWRQSRWGKNGIGVPPEAGELKQLVAGLAHFEEVRPFMPAERRDVNGYRTADDLLDAFTTVPLASRKALRRQRKTNAMAGSDVLYEQGNWKLVRLKNRDAAQWWGIGTRWCTASKLDNGFERYALKGDLLVLVTPTGRYQLSVGTGECRDVLDCPVPVPEALHSAPHVLISILTELQLPVALASRLGTTILNLEL